MNKEYKRLILKRMIVLCWVLLIVCFVVKAFGSNMFNIVCDNEVFISICNVLDNNIVIRTIIQYINYTITTLLFLFSVLMIKCDKKNIITILVSSTICFAIKNVFIYLNLSIIGLIIELLYLIIFPYIYGTSIKISIFTYILLMIFQIISLFVKNVSPVSLPDNSLLALIFIIDYHIMTVLMYLYLKIIKEEKLFMNWGIIFLSKDKTQLEAYKNVVVKKHIKETDKLKDKHSKELAKIDAKIAKAN